METALAIQPKFTANNFLIDYKAEQVDLIKATYARGASDAEFELLLYQSRIYGLDILTRKIWCIKYGTAPALIFAGRDGFLEIAHRNPAFDGMNTTVAEHPKAFTVRGMRWENNVKVPFEKTFNSQFVATCEVWRKDKTRPFTITVWEEEYSTGLDNWEKKRRTMISKVAESQCLRKGFSISGVYAPEEMGDVAQGPDIQTATVVEEGAPENGSNPLTLDENKEQEDVKRLKFLRGELNQALLDCKDEKAYKAVWQKFNRTHGTSIWKKPTNHNPTETFDSLATTHFARIKNNSVVTDWNTRMTACASLAEFEKLQAEYVKTPALETTYNDDLINEKGAFFGAPGYDESKGAK